MPKHSACAGRPVAQYLPANPQQQAQALGGAGNARYLEVVLLYNPQGAGPAPPAPPNALVLEVRNCETMSCSLPGELG